MPEGFRKLVLSLCNQAEELLESDPDLGSYIDATQMSADISEIREQLDAA